jgi:hypothetical protein
MRGSQRKAGGGGEAFLDALGDDGSVDAVPRLLYSDH